MKKEKDEQTFFCSLCNTIRDEGQHVVLDHIETEHVKCAYECGECGIILPTREITNAHKLKKHGNELLKIVNSITSKYRTITEKQGIPF